MEKTIQIPILLQFDDTKQIGYVEIDKKFIDAFPRMGLAPGFKKNKKGKTEILLFGLVYSKSYIEAFQKYNKKI